MWPFREDPGKWRRLSGMENPAGMTPYEQVRDEQEAEEVWARSRGRRWLEIAPAGLIYHTPERTQTFPWDVVTALKEGAFELGWAVRCTFNCPVINPTGFEPPPPERTAKAYFALIDEAYTRNPRAMSRERLQELYEELKYHAQVIRNAFPELCPHIFAPFNDWLRVAKPEN